MGGSTGNSGGIRRLKAQDLFALQFVSDARLSPDDRHLAYCASYVRGDTERIEVRVLDLDTSATEAIPFSGAATAPRWSPDGRRLAFVGSQENSQRLFMTDASGCSAVALTPAGCQVQGQPSWSADGLKIAYTAVNLRKPKGAARITHRLYRSEGFGIVDSLVLNIHIIDLREGTIRTLDSDRATAMHPAFSPCGKHILFLASDAAAPGYATEAMGTGLRLCIANLATGRISEVLGEGWCISAAAWSPCGQRLVVAGDYQSKLNFPTMGLWVVDRDGSNAQCRTRGFIGNIGLRMHHDMPTWNTSQSNVLCVRDSQCAYATVTTRGCTELWRIALQGPVSCVPLVSGPQSCLLMDASARTERLLYAVSDLRRPWDLHLRNLESGQDTRLTRLNEAVLSQWPAMKVEHLQFASADGLPLEGWHLACADRQGPQPTVMFIHGGPYISTGHIFRFDFHLLAANGYAVLFANFRGSSGYGDAFVQGIVGDWGNRGFPDHMAAVDAAIVAGLADVNRLGVWGPSHGGFATAWIVGHTNRFRGAIIESATTNWQTKYYLADTTAWIVKELGGRPHEIPDIYRARSPLTYAWRCRTPTLLVHGEEDTRCPIAEAEQFYRALHDAGCKTELVRIPEMSHMGDSIGPLPVRLAQNEALLDWFERHL